MTDEQFQEHTRLLEGVKREVGWVFWQLTIVGISIAIGLHQILEAVRALK